MGLAGLRACSLMEFSPELEVGEVYNEWLEWIIYPNHLRKGLWGLGKSKLAEPLGDVGK